MPESKTVTDAAIGSIACPLCKRPAEVHKFGQRTKLNPDDASPRPSYPAKVFINCPPTTGYRGCGTLLASSKEAQARIMELARINGAPRATATSPAPKEKPADAPPPAKQPAISPRKNPFNPFG